MKPPAALALLPLSIPPEAAKCFWIEGVDGRPSWHHPPWRRHVPALL